MQIPPHLYRKIVQPVLPPNILFRTSLVDFLKKAIVLSPLQQSPVCKLFLVCAPAGYGKSILLVDFARHSGIPCCWYTFDTSDNDISIFIKTLIASIRLVFPHFGAKIDQLVEQYISGASLPLKNKEQFQQISDAFIAAIETDINEQWALLLCNYHAINKNEEIRSFINNLLRRQPPRCTIFTESRAIPALELTPLLAHGQLLGLGSNELRFSAQEICELAQLQHTDISREEAQSLAVSFDGWIAGILLSTHLGDIQMVSITSQKGLTWGSPAIRMDKQTLLTYLTNEVFQGEADIYTFLKNTSILQYMHATFCNKLLEITTAETLLAYAEQQGLFITRSNEDSQLVYTCQPALRNLLYAEFRRHDEEHVIFLHRRSAELFFEQQNYEQAISQSLMASAYDVAARMIIAVAKLLIPEKVELFVHWIDAFPPSELQHYPRVMLLRADIHLLKYEYAQAQPLLEQTYDLLITQPGQIDADETPTLLAEVLIAQSSAIFRTGDYLRTQELCEQALKHLSADQKVLRALAYQRMGTCASVLGDCLTGITQMQQAIQLWGHNTENHQIANLHSCLANAYSMIGNVTLAEHHRTRAIAICDRLGDTRGKINNLIWLGILKRNSGLFDEAEEMFKEIITAAQNEHFLSGEAYALFNLGSTYQYKNAPGKALAITEESLRLARLIGDNHLMNQVLCEFAMIYLLMSDPHTALLLIEQTDVVSTTENTNYDILLREMTRGTIMLFQRRYQDAYRCLTAIATSMPETGLLLTKLKVHIRLAACQLALGQQKKVQRLMEEVVALSMQGNYEQIAQIELQRFPELWQAIQQEPKRSHAIPSQQKEAVKEQDLLSNKPVLDEVSKATLRIQAFGEPAVIINNNPIARWRIARSMELYFFLLDYGRPIRKEQLLNVFWSEVDDSTDQALRSSIYYLRKTIGEACLVSDKGIYLLDHSKLYEEVWYDVTVFKEQHMAAHKAMKEKDDVTAKKHLQKMIDLYRGDYVQSFYSDWCTLRRDELRSIFMDTRRRLALIAWRNEQVEESMNHWQHLLAIDNCSEDAHYGLMRSYLRQGKRELAVRQYQRCVDILREELSIMPGQAIQSLYQRLLESH